MWHQEPLTRFCKCCFSLLICFTGKAGVIAIWGQLLRPAPCSPLSPASLRHQQSPSEALLSLAVPSPYPPHVIACHLVPHQRPAACPCLAHLVRGLREGPSPPLQLKRDAVQPLAMTLHSGKWPCDNMLAALHPPSELVQEPPPVSARPRPWHVVGMCNVLGWTGPRPGSRGVMLAAVLLPSSLPAAAVQRSKTRISEFPNSTHTTRTTEVVSALQKF